jgi:PAS domain S-box-containing protein
MRLNKKVLIIVGVAFLCTIGILYAITSNIVLGSFAKLEEQNIRINVKRVQNALQGELTELDSTAGDWAPWNETRDFVLDGNKEYINNNLVDVTLVNLRLNFMIFFNASDKLIYAKGVDLIEGKEKSVTKTLIKPLLSYKSLFQHTNPSDSKTGIILLPESPVLIAAWPISNNEVQEPVHGTLIIGRYLDDKEIQNLMEKTELSINFTRADSSKLPSDFETARSLLSKEVPVVIQELNTETIAGYTKLDDINGNPGLFLKVEMPRDILKHGRYSTDYFMWVLLFVGVIVLLVLLATLQITILGPIGKLSRHILAVGKSGDLSVRLPMKRKDEIGILANEFDNMLTQLQKRSTELETVNAKLQEDIDNRIQVERALRDSEATLKSIFLAAPTGIGMVSNRILKQVNARLCGMLGYSNDELIEQSARILYPSQEEYEWVGKEKYEQINKKGTGTVETCLRRKDGKIISVLLSSTPIDPKNHSAGVTFTALDITEQKEAEKERKYLEERLARSQKMEALGLLAGGVAHDLNNVLSGIVSYPELILMDLPEDSKLRKPIETMQESGHRAAAVVQDLITVARGVATTKEPLNLNDLIGGYLNSPEFKKLEQFYPTATVKTNLDADLFNIAGSHVHIRKVVMNLVSNASEAIEDGGNVTISTLNRYIDRPLRGYDDVSTGEYVVLAISDDGSGISSDDLERIFEPFYSKKVMGRSGTGLGLAVVWNVVQDHKGYIDVTTDENGTTFELYFPITREEISSKDLSIPIKDYKGDGETILVVDDVESQREISCKMLDTLGYKTKAVSSGEEAVEYLKEHTVDLILLDMIMDQGINGRETYEQIIKIHPNQKAIIASGFAETDDVKEAQKLGAGQYIKKPLTLEKIGIAVRDELKK